MVFQSATILVILVYVNYHAAVSADRADLERSAVRFRDFCIWLTLVITVVSGLLYVRRAVGMYRAI